VNGVTSFFTPIFGRTYSLTDRVRILRAAARLIGKPGKFAQGTLARRADGTPCSPLDPEASCFCGLGAVVRATSTLGLLPKGFEDEDGRGDYQACYDLAHGIVGAREKGDEVVRTNDRPVNEKEAKHGVAKLLESFASFFAAKK
jgi:hypothetical protein